MLVWKILLPKIDQRLSAEFKDGPKIRNNFHWQMCFDFKIELFSITVQCEHSEVINWRVSCLSLVFSIVLVFPNVKSGSASDAVLCKFTTLTSAKIWSTLFEVGINLSRVSAIHFSSFSQNLLVSCFFLSVILSGLYPHCPKSSTFCKP